MQTGLEGFEVERVVEIGAGGAECFHRGGSLVVGRCGGCADLRVHAGLGAADGRRVAGMDIRPHRMATARRAGAQSAGRVSRIRIATITPEAAVNAATARIATRASNRSARSPTRIAPTANPMSRQKR